MKTLLLLRHAKSSWGDADMPDFQRPLNKRGMKDAPEMGRRMAVKRLQPDLVLCSPAQRARSTWLGVHSKLGSDTGTDDLVSYEQAIYEANPQTLLTLLQSQPKSADTLLLIGHNPGMEMLANTLSPEPVGHLPTCALVRLQIAADNWADVATADAELIEYDYPKKK